MRDAAASLGLGAIALACCGVMPFVAGAIGGAAFVPLLGIGGAALAACGLAAAMLVRRRRRDCAPESEARP